MRRVRRSLAPACWLIALLPLAGCSGSSSSTEGASTPGDFDQRSVEELQLSCEHEDGRACFELARRYRDGVGVARSLESAYGWMQASCKLGHALGCNQAGWAALHGRGIARDFALAGRYFAQACRSGDEPPEACDSRAFALLTGLGETRVDLEQSTRLYERVCRGGVPHGCLALAILEKQGLDHGRAAAPEVETAACTLKAEGLERSCMAEPDPQFCLLGAMMFRTGTCTGPDEARAKRLLLRAEPFRANWPEK